MNKRFALAAVVVSLLAAGALFAEDTDADQCGWRYVSLPDLFQMV